MRDEDDEVVRIPAASDPRWVEWTKPLLDALSEPRDMHWIASWRRQNDIGHTWLLNMLAWLSMNRLVLDVHRDGDGEGDVRWISAACWKPGSGGESGASNVGGQP